MKGQSAMRMPVLVAVLSVMLPIASSSQMTGIVQRAEALQAKLERFASIPGSDVIEPGETNAVSYVDECDEFFCAYIDSMGWTTNLAVESLVVVVSNLVGSVHSNRFLQACTAEVATGSRMSSCCWRSGRCWRWAASTLVIERPPPPLEGSLSRG